jgi:hypothetical protein
MVVGEHFFEKTEKAFTLAPDDAGCICALYENSLEPVPASTMEETNAKSITGMKRREGGVFTFKRSVFDTIPPIPKQLKTYFGDDWYWFYTFAAGCRWYKDIGNKVHHAGGVTVTRLGQEVTLREERQMFYKIRNNIIGKS